VDVLVNEDPAMVKFLLDSGVNYQVIPACLQCAKETGFIFYNPFLALSYLAFFTEKRLNTVDR
jgi:hypothetical protein